MTSVLVTDPECRRMLSRPPSPPIPAVLRLLVSLALAAISFAGIARPAAAFTPAEAKMPMTVTLVRSDAAGCGADCPEWLALTGVIGAGTPALFSAALARLGRRNVPVLVDSPGGSVEAAMAMGRAIRSRRMTVSVAGTSLDDCAPTDRACAALRRNGERSGFVAGGVAACASACVLVLAAGTERSVGEHSYVGVHQMIVHQTLTRVMNYFRILRRMVNGRPVEVSRTLIGTRPISSHQVQKAAPEAMYSEVDRYLLGLGIAESIMPLMRSTPPSGIHWLTPAEVAATRIATDTTDALTLVARSVEPKPAGPAARGAMALVGAMLGDGARAAGIVNWTVEGDAASPELVGTVEVPARNLKGRLTIRRDTAPGTGQAFSATIDFGPAAAIESGRVWTTEAPRICDARTCNLPFTPVAQRDDGQGRRVFGVIAPWGDTLLSALRDREWISLGLSADDGKTGWVSLSLKDDARAVVIDWEHRCCGLAPTQSDPRPTAALASPPPAPTVPAPAVTLRTEPAVATARASFSLLRPASEATPIEGKAAVTWTLIARLDRLGAPGSTALLGELSIPEAGLRLSFEAGPAPGGAPGEIALDFSAVGDPVVFGPAQALAIPPVWAQDGHVAILAEQTAALAHGGGFTAVLSSAADPPSGARLALELTDASRRLEVRLPLDGPLGTLLRLARKGRPATG